MRSEVSSAPIMPLRRNTNRRKVAITLLERTIAWGTELSDHTLPRQSCLKYFEYTNTTMHSNKLGRLMWYRYI